MMIMQSIRSKIDLPACMQEAVLMYAISKNDPALLERFKIDEKLKEDVIHFVSVYKKYGNDRKLAEEKLKKYKGTYCYFYAFSNTK